jgi:AcrR family transcriptional regulator
MVSIVTAPTPERARRPSRSEVREGILLAALAVFAERGFDRSSLDLVAQRAGFTKGAVYSNFDSKEALFLALMDRQVEIRLRKTVAAVDSVAAAESPTAVGRVLAAASVDDAEWQLVFLDYWARAVREPAVREQFIWHRRRLKSVIAEAIARIHPHTDGATTARDLATLALALSNGYAIEALVDPADTNPELVALVWDGLLGR